VDGRDTAPCCAAIEQQMEMRDAACHVTEFRTNTPGQRKLGELRVQPDSVSVIRDGEVLRLTSPNSVAQYAKGMEVDGHNRNLSKAFEEAGTDASLSTLLKHINKGFTVHGPT